MRANINRYASITKIAADDLTSLMWKLNYVDYWDTRDHNTYWCVVQMMLWASFVSSVVIKFCFFIPISKFCRLWLLLLFRWNYIYFCIFPLLPYRVYSDVLWFDFLWTSFDHLSKGDMVDLTVRSKRQLAFMFGYPSIHRASCCSYVYISPCAWYTVNPWSRR